MTGSGLGRYLTTVILARSSAEAAAAALLIVSVAVLGSATSGSFLVAALTATAAVAGPVVGALVDRTKHPRGAFAIALCCFGVGLAGVAICIGYAPNAVLILFAALAGIGFPAVTGGWSAQIPRVIGPGTLRRAYSVDAATYSVASVAAPPLAAATVAVAARAPLWLPVVLAAGALVALRALPLKAPTAARPKTSLLNDVRTGTALMMNRLPLRRVVIITTVGWAGQSAVFVCTPILALSVGGSLQFTSAILLSYASGGLATAIWFARHPVARPDRMVILGTAASGVALAGIGLAHTPALLLAAVFVSGGVQPPVLSSIFQVRTRESPEHLRSQVFTTSASLRTGTWALLTAVFGVLVSHSVTLTIAVAAVLELVGVAVGLAFGPHVPHRADWVRRGSRNVEE